MTETGAPDVKSTRFRLGDCGLIAMMISELLIKDIERFLPSEETDEETLLTDKEKTAEKSQRKILEEMKKLDQ